jgi:guanylate kinase
MTIEAPIPEMESPRGNHFKIESEPVEAGHLFIFIGPQTGGKSSVLGYVDNEFGARKITTVTTRDLRPDDDPNSYTYVTQEVFKAERARGEIVFVDHYGNGSSYGNPKSEVQSLLAGENRTVIVDVPHIYELEGELQTIFGDQASTILAHTHIFYIGVPSVRDIPIRFEQRQAEKGVVGDPKKARQKFQSRLKSDIHSWRELTDKEQTGEVTIVRYRHPLGTTDNPLVPDVVLSKPHVPTVHLIINEDGHLEDTTVPTIYDIIRRNTQPSS